jgi:serine-type D-Ala-D-Ala carboxypeptidase (penicillin-binding protein 5/6)
VATTGRLAVRHRSDRRLQWWALAACVLVLLGGLLIRAIANESPPPLQLARTIPANVMFPGSAPVIAWPRGGQAAVEVEGLGSFGTSGAQTPVPIASVAKVMTAYLTLREHPLTGHARGFTITVSAADAAEQQQRTALGESTLAVRAGERISERQALEALLLPSANNVAALLASHEAGGASAFLARMNSTARELGMRSTTYTDPSGFDDSTVSTAEDQLKLASVAMRDPLFAEIVAKPSVTLPLVGRVANYDAIVGRDGYVGVKTGSDRAAGGCLVFAKRVLIGGQRLTVLGAVLGQREGPLIEAALTSAERLGDSAASALSVRTVLPAATAVLSANAGDGRSTPGVTAAALRTVGWGGLTVALRVLPRAPMKSASAGQVLAGITAGDARSSVLASRTVAGPSLGWRLRNLF